MPNCNVCKPTKSFKTFGEIFRHAEKVHGWKSPAQIECEAKGKKWKTPKSCKPKKRSKK